MRITKELQAYVEEFVNKTIPNPLSKEDADKVNLIYDKLREEFKNYMSRCAFEFIEKAIKDNPVIYGSILEPRLYNVYLETKAGTNVAHSAYAKDKIECENFRSNSIKKIIALLSVQKEVSDLDNFILNVIQTIK